MKKFKLANLKRLVPAISLDGVLHIPSGVLFEESSFSVIYEVKDVLFVTWHGYLSPPAYCKRDACLKSHVWLPCSWFVYVPCSLYITFYFLIVLVSSSIFCTQP